MEWHEAVRRGVMCSGEVWRGAVRCDVERWSAGRCSVVQCSLAMRMVVTAANALAAAAEVTTVVTTMTGSDGKGGGGDGGGGGSGGGGDEDGDGADIGSGDGGGGGNGGDGGGGDGVAGAAGVMKGVTTTKTMAGMVAEVIGDSGSNGGGDETIRITE